MDKKYQIIYADPPWQYTSKSVPPEWEVTNHYKTMPIEDIKKLPIKELADKNCYLFLWVTSPILDDGIDTLKAWGFEYKTIAFCWAKTYRDNSWVLGMGSYTRSNVEICLLGTIGRLERIDASVRQLIVSQLREHSQKPRDARERIVQLYGDLPRVELFARKPNLLFDLEKYDGWDVWGNEVQSDIQLGESVCQTT